MKVELTNSYCSLIREPGDKRIAKESTVAFHLRNLLNKEHLGKFVRIYPDGYGLNSCKVGVADHKAGVYLWHERYAIESAHIAFNEGEVTFQRVNEDQGDDPPIHPRHRRNRGDCRHYAVE